MEAFITKFCTIGVQEYEEGETDGRPHVQGFFYLEKKARMVTVRRLWIRGEDEDPGCFDLAPDPQLGCSGTCIGVDFSGSTPTSSPIW